MKSFTFYHITDAHTLCPEDCTDAESRKEAEERLAVLDTVFGQIIADKETDTVLITGDNANVGQPSQHRTFIEHTLKLKEAGKKVYVITATHDFGLMAVYPDGQSEKREGSVQRKELRPLYNELGFSDAIAEFGELSYVAKPCDGFRILCLNDDGDGKVYRGYSEEQQKWILEQIKDAHEAGDYIFAATHHPVIPPSPIYPVLGKHEMLGDNLKIASAFADNGVKFIFTGHTHMHSIRKYTSESGNPFYDINTGTISEFPLKFRKVTIFDNGEADIKTIPVGDVPFDTNGKTANKYYSDIFDRLVLGSIEGMANDYDMFMRNAGRLALSRDLLLKLKTPLTLAGKTLNTITLGGVGWLLLAPWQVDKSVKKDKFKNLLAAGVRNAYGGDEPYGPETPENKVFMLIISRIYPFVKKKLKGTPFEDLKSFFTSIVYDPTPDADDYLK